MLLSMPASHRDPCGFGYGIQEAFFIGISWILKRYILD